VWNLEFLCGKFKTTGIYTSMKMYGGMEVKFREFLTSPIVCSASRFARFSSGERTPGVHWLGGWVGPRAVLDAVKRKIPSPRRESNTRTPTVQPVALRYTDWAITALMFVYFYL
jgi:hypothetical protein